MNLIEFMKSKITCAVFLMPTTYFSTICKAIVVQSEKFWLRCGQILGAILRAAPVVYMDQVQHVIPSAFSTKEPWMYFTRLSDRYSQLH